MERCDVSSLLRDPSADTEFKLEVPGTAGSVPLKMTYSLDRRVWALVHRVALLAQQEHPEPALAAKVAAQREIESEALALDGDEREERIRSIMELLDNEVYDIVFPESSGEDCSFPEWQRTTISSMLSTNRRLLGPWYDLGHSPGGGHPPPTNEPLSFEDVEFAARLSEALAHFKARCGKSKVLGVLPKKFTELSDSTALVLSHDLKTRRRVMRTEDLLALGFLREANTAARKVLLAPVAAESQDGLLQRCCRWCCGRKRLISSKKEE